MKKNKMTTKALSVLLTVLMLFTSISVGIIIPEAKAEAAETGETLTVTTIAQLNEAIGKANTAGVNKITTIKLGGNITYSGSLASFTELTTANVVFDFSGYSLLLEYTVSGDYENGQTHVQLPSANQGKTHVGTDTFTNGMFIIRAGSTMKIINTKPSGISQMKVYTDFADTKKNSTITHQTSSSLIYCEGNLIVGDTNTTYNSFSLYAHSSCRATNGDNPLMYGKKTANANAYTVTINNANSVFKMYGGTIDATGISRARRGGDNNLRVYALNIEKCYSAEIYGGEVKLGNSQIDTYTSIKQSSSTASGSANANVSAIRCNEGRLYIFDINCTVSTIAGSDTSNDNSWTVSNIYAVSENYPVNVYGGYIKFYSQGDKGDDNSTATTTSYLIRGPFNIASAGNMQSYVGSEYEKVSTGRNSNNSREINIYTVFIGADGVLKDSSNNILQSGGMTATNGIDMFSYNTFRDYLAQYSTTLDVYCGDSVISTNGTFSNNGNATTEVGSTKYLRNGYTHKSWAGKTHPGGTYNLSYTTPQAAGLTTDGGSLFLVPAWEENLYTITYDWNDTDGATTVTDASSCPISYKITSTSKLGTPVRPGYEFTGWEITSHTYPQTDTKKPWSLGTYPAGFSLNGRNGNLWLKAHWEALPYSATFNLNGGNIGGDTSDIVKEYNVNKIFQFPQGVRKDYYNFDGNFSVFSTDPGGSSWEINDNVTYDMGTSSEIGNYGNVTFIANFTPIQYTVTYNSNGGSSVDDEDLKTYNYESTHTLPAVTRTGYSFVGWLPEISSGAWSGAKTYAPGTSFNKMHGNVTLVAQWESATYSLKLDLDTTESIPGGITEYNYAYKDALILNNPAKTGYVFAGWKVKSAPDAGTTWVVGEEFKEGISSGKVTIPANRMGSVTLEPMWDTDTYTITFNANGGNGVPAKDYNIEENISLPSTTKKGYTFTGWSVSPNSNEGNWTKEVYTTAETLTGMYGDVTLVANWEKTNYVITLDANDGIVSSGVLSYDFEKEVALPVPTRTGYTFDGWRVSQADAGASWEIDKVYTDVVPAGQYGNMTLEAKWVHTEYTIHFTGQGTLPQDIKYYIDSPDFNLPAASNAGYRFTHWSVTVAVGNWGMNESINTQTVISGRYGNVTLNANYEPITYSITYKDIDGTEDVVTYNMTTPVVIKDYSRDGYTFGGWTAEYTDAADGSGWPSVCQPGTYGEGERYGNVILTPILTPTEYTVTFIPEGGTPFADLIYTIESTDELPVPVKTGYDFAGWLVTSSGGNWADGETVEGETAVTDRFGNVTLTAQWTPKLYTITWETGSGTFTTQVPYDSVPDYSTINTYKAPDAQYTYTFTGWSPAVSKVTGEATYTAQYSKTVNNYNVTWVYETDETSGDKTETSVYAYGAHPVFNNGINPTKTSTSGKYYRFVGWFDENGNELTADSVVKGNVTYTARYMEIQAPRTVTWIINGVRTETMWAVGETPEYVGTPRKPDANGMKYTFISWDKPIEEVVAGKDYEYTAQFREEPQTYTAQFDLNGGSYSGSTDVAYNKTAGLNMPVPSKDGYTFLGWRVTSNDGTWTQTELLKYTTYTGLWGNVSFVAEYSATEYIIKVEADDGTVPEYKYTIESTDELPELAKDGFILTGWMIVSADGNWIAGDTVEPDKVLTGMFGNVTIHPLWTARLYKINWVSGDITQTVEFKFGQSVVAYPPISKAGYTAQWDNTVPAIMPAEDLTFTAVYTPIQYYLRFNSAGGSEVTNFYYDITSTKALPVPVRDGATFKGWRVSASDGSWTKNKVYDIGTVLTGQYGNATLTAVWEIEIHTVTWVAGDVTKVTMWYHGAVPSYDGVPYKSADDYNSYIFAGWDKEITTVTQDVTYTAVFTAIERLYTVKWSVDGFIKEEKLYKYGEMPVYSGAVPSRPSTSEFDFTFAGWTPEVNKVTQDITYVAMFDVFTKLQGLRIDKSAVFLKIGEQSVLSAIISPATATSKDVNWISADESVATVDINGKITAVGSGDTLIRVESKDGQFKSYCYASVAPVISQYLVVSAGYVSTTRLPGEAIQLSARVMPENTTAKNITWTSSDTTIAMVDANGLVVFGNVAGTAVITASCDGYASGSIEVTTTLKSSELEDDVKTYVIMFNKSTSSYIINGVTYEAITIIANEGDTIEFLLTEPHFVTLNGVQMSRDTDGVFRIKDIKDNYTVISTERADLGFDEDVDDDDAYKPTFFDRLKEFFRSIIEFFRNLFK